MKSVWGSYFHAVKYQFEKRIHFSWLSGHQNAPIKRRIFYNLVRSMPFDEMLWMLKLVLLYLQSVCLTIPLFSGFVMFTITVANRPVNSQSAMTTSDDWQVKLLKRNSVAAKIELKHRKNIKRELMIENWKFK
jgi:hypothetical protein